MTLIQFMRSKMFYFHLKIVTWFTYTSFAIFSLQFTFTVSILHSWPPHNPSPSSDRLPVNNHRLDLIWHLYIYQPADEDQVWFKSTWASVCLVSSFSLPTHTRPIDTVSSGPVFATLSTINQGFRVETLDDHPQVANGSSLVGVSVIYLFRGKAMEPEIGTRKLLRLISGKWHSKLFITTCPKWQEGSNNYLYHVFHTSYKYTQNGV